MLCGPQWLHFQSSGLYFEPQGLDFGTQALHLSQWLHVQPQVLHYETQEYKKLVNLTNRAHNLGHMALAEEN